MSKSLLKTTVASEISLLNVEVRYVKEYVQSLYTKCNKEDKDTEFYFGLLNVRRNQLRQLKRKLKNLEKLQKRIKQLPDELLDTSLPLFMQKMTPEEAEQLGL